MEKELSKKVTLFLSSLLSSSSSSSSSSSHLFVENTQCDAVMKARYNWWSGAVCIIKKRRGCPKRSPEDSLDDFSPDEPFPGGGNLFKGVSLQAFSSKGPNGEG